MDGGGKPMSMPEEVKAFLVPVLERPSFTEKRFPQKKPLPFKESISCNLFYS